MPFQFFTGKRDEPINIDQLNIPIPHFKEREDPKLYHADEGLINAVNISIFLGLPLLITGEPGTGKTQLAYRVAWEMNLGSPLKFETKSTSTSKDLFYYYDTLARFQSFQTNKEERYDAKEYITYNALGEAIIKANDPSVFSHILPKDFDNKGAPKKSVVLIDEIDKATRDFPNDILNEIEKLYFKIPELNNIKVSADIEMSPIVIITSNSEKHLPDAFLRRCVFYHIEFPEPNRLLNIVENRLQEIYPEIEITSDDNKSFLHDAIDLFFELRNSDQGLRKKPSTGELLVWIETLYSVSDRLNPFEDIDLLTSSISTLVKSVDDLEIGKEVVLEWKEKKS